MGAHKNSDRVSSEQDRLKAARSHHDITFCHAVKLGKCALDVEVAEVKWTLPPWNKRCSASWQLGHLY